MHLFVLAGGFGTRLKTEVSNVPKALAPVGDTPFLKLQLDRWISQGIRNFTFLLHHKSEQIIQFLKSEKLALGNEVEFRWIEEKVALGTGGSVANALKKIRFSGDFLVANADTWLSGGIYEITNSRTPSLAVVYLEDIERYGRVKISDDSLVTCFEEKPDYSNRGWISTGLSKLNSQYFLDWDGAEFSIERELYAKLAQTGNFGATKLNYDFIDIGVPVDYKKFCKKFGEKF